MDVEMGERVIVRQPEDGVEAQMWYEDKYSLIRNKMNDKVMDNTGIDLLDIWILDPWNYNTCTDNLTHRQVCITWPPQEKINVHGLWLLNSPRMFCII